MLRNSPKVGKDREELVRHVPLASSKAVVNLQSRRKAGPRGKALVLHLSRFRRRADRLQLNPRHAASPPDNDNLPGEFRRQQFNLLLNPLRQVHAVPLESGPSTLLVRSLYGRYLSPEPFCQPDESFPTPLFLSMEHPPCSQWQRDHWILCVLRRHSVLLASLGVLFACMRTTSIESLQCSRWAELRSRGHRSLIPAIPPSVWRRQEQQARSVKAPAPAPACARPGHPGPGEPAPLTSVYRLAST